MEDPLALFPVVVWEMILDRVGDSEAVYNVLQMYPKLDLAFQSKKHKWLLGKILPFIASWTNLLEDGELLKLRLGCKTWLQAMDNFLETQQPRFIPYHPDLQTDSQFIWNSKAILSQLYDKDEKGYVGGVKFLIDEDEDTPKEMEEFMEQIKAHPEDSNPFLARSLSVSVWGACGFNADQHERAFQFLKKVMEVVEKFGKHIWFYSINFDVEGEDRDQALDWLARSICLLPNLKGLDVSCNSLLFAETIGDLIGHATQEHRVEGWEAMPASLTFPSLESIRVSGCQGDALASYLLDGIKTPIRKLDLNLSSWRDDYSRFLSTVTELKLEMIGTDSGGEWTRLRDLMSTLEAPLLVKLELQMKFEYGKKQKPVFVEDDIFQWIKCFPSLKYFDIGGEDNKLLIQERGTLLPERDSLPSLQFLCIRDSFALSYHFLTCLPSLQHLQFFTDSKAKVVDLSNEKVVKIRDQIETGTMHNSNVWELLPSLRSVTILDEDGKKESKCDREKYEYFKEHPDYQGLPDFRKDIAMHLENSKLVYYNPACSFFYFSSDSDTDDDDDSWATISDSDAD